MPFAGKQRSKGGSSDDEEDNLFPDTRVSERPQRQAGTQGSAKRRGQAENSGAEDESEKVCAGCPGVGYGGLLTGHGMEAGGAGEEGCEGQGAGGKQAG